MWERVPLGALGKWTGGGTPSKSNPRYWTGAIPWVSPKDMKTERIHDSEDHITKLAVEESATSLIPADSVLVVTRSGILRHSFPVAINTVPVTVNQDLKALTPKPGVTPEYIAWALRAFRDDILHSCAKQGTTVNSIETAKLLRFEIPVAPLDQQHRIIAEIEKQFSRLDEAVANLKRVKANLKRYKAAVLKAAVEGKLVIPESTLARKENRRYETGSDLLDGVLAERNDGFSKRGRKYREPSLLDDTLPTPPLGWCWASWDQISVWITYGFTRPMPHVEDGIPIVTARHVLNGRIDTSSTEKTTPSAFKELSQKDKPARGDVLITKDGTIGRSAVVETNDPFCINQSVAVVWLCSDRLNRRFLRLVIESPMTQRLVSSKARGVAIQHLSITDFARMPVPLPPPHEQQRIVAEVDRRMSIIEELEAGADAEMKRADHLRQAILARSFSAGHS